MTDIENMLLPKNLAKIDRLSRRGLLLFLDKETSRENTERLRIKARREAIYQSGVDVDRDLARIELMIWANDR